MSINEALEVDGDLIERSDIEEMLSSRAWRSFTKHLVKEAEASGRAREDVNLAHGQERYLSGFVAAMRKAKEIPQEMMANVKITKEMREKNE